MKFLWFCCCFCCVRNVCKINANPILFTSGVRENNRKRKFMWTVMKIYPIQEHFNLWYSCEETMFPCILHQLTIVSFIWLGFRNYHFYIQSPYCPFDIATSTLKLVYSAYSVIKIVGKSHHYHTIYAHHLRRTHNCYD